MAYLTAAALILAAVGTYVSYDASQTQKATAKSVSEYNAKLAENQTIQADLEARENSNRQRRQNRLAMSSQRARLAKMGVSEAGSPLAVLAEQAGLMELQIQDQKRADEARRRAGFATAAQTRIEGQALASAYNKQGQATLLSGASNIAGGYGRYQATGAL
jgi:hypothetical protein